MANSNKTERRYSQFRASGNVLAGTAIKYGDVAVTSMGRERFRAGCFKPIGDVILNYMHLRTEPICRNGPNGNLQLIDTEQSLEVRAELNPDFDGKILDRVRTQTLRGLSVEFIPVEESIEENIRVISKANLVGIGLVDKPAYPKSVVQLRASGFRSRVPYGKSLGCECVSGDCTHAVLSGESFIDIDEIIAGKSERDVTAVVGDYKDTVGSLKQGTLRLEQTDDGLDIEIPRLPATQAVNDLIEMAAGATLLARPYFKQTEQSKSESVIETDDEGNKVLRVKGANLKSIVLGFSDRDDGWSPGEFVPVEQRNNLVLAPWQW